MQDAHTRPSGTAELATTAPLPPPRHRVWLAMATLGTMALVLGVSTGFLWLERERTLTETAELAVRGAHRLATDLQQSLTVARAAIDQFNEQLQQASSQPFQAPRMKVCQQQGSPFFRTQRPSAGKSSAYTPQVRLLPR